MCVCETGATEYTLSRASLSLASVPLSLSLSLPLLPYIDKEEAPKVVARKFPRIRDVPPVRCDLHSAEVEADVDDKDEVNYRLEPEHEPGGEWVKGWMERRRGWGGQWRESPGEGQEGGGAKGGRKGGQEVGEGGV